MGSGLLTAPGHPQNISEGSFQEAHQGRGYWKENKLSRLFAWLSEFSAGGWNSCFHSGLGFDSQSLTLSDE